MKALVITNLSGPDALAIQDNNPEPTLKPGQKLVRVAAGGLNFADFMTAQGGYPGTPAPPLIAGREFSGVEESGGRVMGYTQWAAFAEKVAAYPSMLWPVPDAWTDEQAAAFPVNFFTAYLGYWQAGMTPDAPCFSAGAPYLSRSLRQGGDFDSAPLDQTKPGQSNPGRTPRVLIHAVAGGVGTAAVQIGR